MSSGFYRIYLKHNQEEYSYVGISKNIESRIKQHFEYVELFYGSRKLLFDTLYYLDKKTIPSQNSQYVKLAFFLHHKDHGPEDLKWEILENRDINHIDSQFKEMEYIKLYKSDYKGFNGLFAKDFQLLFDYNNSNQVIRKKLLNLKQKQDIHKMEILKKLKACNNKKDYNQQFMPWISWQFKSVLEKKFQNYFDEFCKKLFDKIKYKIFSSYLQLGYTKKELDQEMKLIEDKKKNFNFQNLIKKAKQINKN